MSFVVKKMCYLDKNGMGVISPKKAEYYEDRETAELVASVCGGEVFKTFKPERKTKKAKVFVVPKEKTKEPKSNQAWMRGAK
ncbi:hypothetical protein IGI57_002511 [Enterococcus sp. DIV0213j]|uniref:hypothetical protein n=1 Tax=Enterococcus sp. DIV0213j TaxID=2774649 RepID=UPI003D28D952